jgi:hypothetical protein
MMFRAEPELIFQQRFHQINWNMEMGGAQRYLNPANVPGIGLPPLRN